MVIDFVEFNRKYAISRLYEISPKSLHQGQKISLRPTFVALVTKFRQNTENLNNVASIATDTTHNYNH